MSQTMTPPAGGPGGGMPMGGTAPGGAPGGDDTDAGDSGVVCTITLDGQGGYVIYSGDEPEGSDEGDQSGDDANAMGDAGNAPAPTQGAAPTDQGQHANSVGEALKIVMGILQDAESSAPGGANQQFAAGFTGSQSPTPTSGTGQKYG